MRSRRSDCLRYVLCATLLLAPGSGCKSINTRTLKVSAASMYGALEVGAGLYVLTAVANSMPESRGVMIASQPVGARVLIDGKDSGFATPCCLALEDKKQRVDLVLDGYMTASRVVTDDERAYLIYWDEGYLGTNSYHFPLFLNLYDGWVPLRFEQTYSPERIFVRMRPSAGP